MGNRISKKIFLNINDNKLVTLKNPDNLKYYSYIAEQKEKGNRQILITTKQMIKILEIYIYNSNAEIMEIIFLENDADYKKEIDELVTKLNKRNIPFANFIKKIEFLNSNDSVDIQSIEFNYRLNDLIFIVKLYLNGILYISDHGEEATNNEIKKLIMNIGLLN